MMAFYFSHFNINKTKEQKDKKNYKKSNTKTQKLKHKNLNT